MIVVNKKGLKTGFSLIEIIIVLSIITVLATIVTLSFSSIGSKQALEKTTVSIISILDEAKSMALSSKDFSDYGVRIESDKLTTFKGSFGMENEVYNIPSLVKISSFSIGGGNDIIFKKVSGSTSATGTITISVINDSSEYDMIQISQTGLVEKI